MVLLINPQYKEQDEGEWNEPIPHIGQAYIAAFYRKQGGTVKLLDANYYGWDNKRLLSEMDPYMEECKLIGISAYTPTWKYVKELVEMIKINYPEVHITLGGYHPTLFSEQVLAEAKGVDSIIIGEGEITFTELAQCIHKGVSWKSIKGIAYKTQNGIQKNESREFVENLDDFPFPARDYLTDIKQTVPICASRGCYSNCSFCSISSFYTGNGRKKFRMRSAKNIVDEIELLFHEYGNKEYWFVDDNFLSGTRFDKNYVIEFAEEIKKRNLNIHFHLACRADEITENNMSILAEVGLKSVMVGIESANERQLKFYNKCYKPEMCINAIDILKKCKIRRIHIGFIMFDPYVTIEELLENLNYFKQIKYTSLCRFESPITLFNRLKGYPGTLIYKKLEKVGILPDENNDYEFFDIKVKKIYTFISEWNKKIYEIYKLMPAWIFKDLIAAGEVIKAKHVYELAQKYMEIDESFFEKILELFSKDVVSDEQVYEIMRAYQNDIASIFAILNEYKNYLLLQH